LAKDTKPEIAAALERLSVIVLPEIEETVAKVPGPLVPIPTPVTSIPTRMFVKVTFPDTAPVLVADNVMRLPEMDDTVAPALTPVPVTFISLTIPVESVTVTWVFPATPVANTTS
jgi:hypothetical protein